MFEVLRVFIFVFIGFCTIILLMYFGTKAVMVAVFEVKKYFEQIEHKGEKDGKK